MCKYIYIYIYISISIYIYILIWINICGCSVYMTHSVKVFHVYTNTQVIIVSAVLGPNLVWGIGLAVCWCNG